MLDNSPYMLEIRHLRLSEEFVTVRDGVRRISAELSLLRRNDDPNIAARRIWSILLHTHARTHTHTNTNTQTVCTKLVSICISVKFVYKTRLSLSKLS
jgi:hypothetical protein